MIEETIMRRKESLVLTIQGEILREYTQNDRAGRKESFAFDHRRRGAKWADFIYLT
jgi:hypothetical protein